MGEKKRLIPRHGPVSEVVSEVVYRKGGAAISPRVRYPKKPLLSKYACQDLWVNSRMETMICFVSREANGFRNRV
jgi:hypothetical protein